MIEDKQLNPEELHLKHLQDESRLDRVLKSLNNHLHKVDGISVPNRIAVVTPCIMAGLGVVDKTGDYVVSPLMPEDLVGSQEAGATDGDKIFNKVKNFLKEREIPEAKRMQIQNSLEQTLLHSRLAEINKNTGVSKLKSAYTKIFTEVIPAYHQSSVLDFTGRLFNVMNDWVSVPDGGKNDVVLTPRYTTDLMAKLVEVDKDSYVWDWALGSGGFLISAMNAMLADASNRSSSSKELAEKQIKIKTKQLLGIEKLPDIYILAVLNMILMDDGSSNIINKNSLTEYDGNYSNESEEFPANILLLNPPYSAEGNGMIFVKKAFEKMSNGKGAVIIQDSAGNGKSTEINKSILNNNRLLASIKMPEDLFKATVQTSIYLFEIGKPHKISDKVCFINFGEDGYTRTNRKNASTNLTDTNNAKERYAELIDVISNGIDDALYLKKDETYILDTIDPNDGEDWNFERHVIVDTKPVPEDFISTVSDFLSWTINRKSNVEKLGCKTQSEKLESFENNFILNGGSFQEFKMKELFVVKSNPQLNKKSFIFSDEGKYPYFTRTQLNNGIAGHVNYLNDENKISGDCLAVGMLGIQFFYMENDFYAGQFTKHIRPIKSKIPRFNSFIAQFFIAILNRYSVYLRSFSVSNFKKQFNEIEVSLPIRNSKLDLDYIEQYIEMVELEHVDKLVKEYSQRIQLYKNAISFEKSKISK